MNIIFPDWFDELAEFEVAHKGFLLNFPILIDGVVYYFSFYDIHRLNKDYEETIHQCNFFYEKNLVILPEVTKYMMIHFLQNCFIKTIAL